MSKIVIHPERIRQFGDPKGCAFCLVTNPDLIDAFEIAAAPGYSAVLVRTLAPGESFPDVLARCPEPSHVLVASPACFFDSPPPDLLGARKLIAMACNSTPTDLAAIRHFLGVIERTDPDHLEAFARRFFDIEYLDFVDDSVGVRARFEHLSDRYEWNQQAGPLEWGQQQIAPMGEVSVLPVFIRDFDPGLRLQINGQICLHGHPILHNGSPSFLRTDQARLHALLAGMQEHPVIADVVHGEITRVRANDPRGQPVVDVLEALFRVDSRYRIVWEVGFAINTFLDLLPGNYAMNEVYGASNGCLHFGLGLTPYTQYHLDVICPDVRVVGSRGEVLLGSPAVALAP
jgi:hypothetical protein